MTSPFRLCALVFGASVLTATVVLEPTTAQAIIIWDWSFTTDEAEQFGSGTFTTDGVVPTAGVTYSITEISGTYNRGGTAFSIIGLASSDSGAPGRANQFQWDGTSFSPIIVQTRQSSSDAGGIGFIVHTGTNVGLVQNSPSLFGPALFQFTSFPGSDGLITSSSVAPVPGPLPLFGAAAAFHASRRLRRRLKVTA
jgi:hypothetical protein